MYLKEIEFLNYGRHAHRLFQLQNGLIGVIGPNGSGKSTICDGAYACITGDWSRFSGVKADNIRASAPADEASFIRVVAVHNDVEFEVFRMLRRGKGIKDRANNELRVDGKGYTKDAEITRELEKRLGVNSKLIGNYVFVKQRELFSFLSQTAGERAATYQMLCGTEKAEHICAAISQFTEQNADSFVTVEVDQDAINAKISVATSRVTTLTDALREATTQLVADDKLEKAKGIVEKRRNCLRAEDQRVKILKEIADVKAELLTAEIRLAALKASASDAEALVIAARQEDVKVKNALAAFKRYRDFNTNKESLFKQIKTLTAEIKQRREAAPKLHEDAADYDAITAKLTNAKFQLDHDQHIIEEFEETGVMECPTCGNAAANVQAHITLLQEGLPLLKNSVADLTAKKHAILVAQEAVKQHDRYIANADTRMLVLTAELRGLGEVAKPEGDEASLLPVDLDGLEDKFRDNNARVTEAVSQVGSLQGRLQELEKQQGSTADLIVISTVSDDLLARARAVIQRHEDARIAVSTNNNLLLTETRVLEESWESLEQAKVRAARNRKAVQFNNKLKAIKDVMHRQALPQLVAQNNLQDMEQDINNGLELFNSPFWVEAADDLTFTVHFPGEPAMSALRLSPGLKSVLAMTFRPALGALFDAEIGMMSLDEPTSDLDAPNRQFLAESLLRYASKVRGRNQVIVVTHALELIPAFDQVIDVGVA